MFTKLEINNFRGIRKLELNDFNRINVFVGKNNVGKTTVLEALFLLNGASNAILPLKINGFRGPPCVNIDFAWS
jgi:AAA15 family ATPase/GTPase